MQIHYARIGDPSKPTVVFAHGWGRSHRDFIPVAEALAPSASSILLDLPGFGESARPTDAWGTSEYAEGLHKFLSIDLSIESCIWVGHSFGGRVGLRMAAQFSSFVDALVLVAAAGVPRSRSVRERLKSKINSRLFRLQRSRAKTEDEIIALERKFGSVDYVASRESGLRDIFVKTVSEDQTDSVNLISCPTSLIYGGQDNETPPEIGYSLSSLIKDSRMTVLPELDHISVLDRGRHQIALAIKERLSDRDVV